MTAAALRALRRFVKPEATFSVCELCGTELLGEHAHAHALEARSGRILCACKACGLLFAEQGEGRLWRIPERVERWADVALESSDWDMLGIPIRLAFFVRELPGAGAGRSIYPSPAGPVTSTLSEEQWQLLARRATRLGELSIAVEALLVSALGQPCTFRVPVDQCYRLVGLLRSHWRGVSGGAEMQAELDGFFAELGERAKASERHA